MAFAILTVAGFIVATLLIDFFVQEAERCRGAWWLVPILSAIAALAFMILRREFKTMEDYLEVKVVAISGVVTKHELMSQSYEDHPTTTTIEYNYDYHYQAKRIFSLLSKLGMLPLKRA